jgi:hypothetical protein
MDTTELCRLWEALVLHPGVRATTLTECDVRRLKAVITQDAPHVPLPPDLELRDGEAVRHANGVLCVQLVSATNGAVVDVILSQTSRRLLRVVLQQGPPQPLLPMAFDSTPVDLGNGDVFRGAPMPSYALMASTPLGADLLEWTAAWSAEPFAVLPIQQSRTRVCVMLSECRGHALLGIDSAAKVVLQCRAPFEAAQRHSRGAVPHLDAHNERIVWGNGASGVAVRRRVVWFTAKIDGSSREMEQLVDGVQAEETARHAKEPFPFTRLWEVAARMDAALNVAIRVRRQAQERCALLT